MNLLCLTIHKNLFLSFDSKYTQIYHIVRVSSIVFKMYYTENITCF